MTCKSLLWEGYTRLWPNKIGTRLIFEDDQKVVYIYNPLQDQVNIYLLYNIYIIFIQTMFAISQDLITKMT